MSSYSIETIEGIGPTMGKKLRKAGIKTTGGLLKAGAGKKGRADIAEASGISEDKIRDWCNMADLMRIKGVGEEYSELLEAAGVDTVKELRNRRADNLAAKMVEVNAKKKLVRQVPSEKMVERWVAQAKGLDPVMTY